jgi:GNAT superfamily N-acetyltransferase
LITLRRATDADADAVAAVYLSSFKRALPGVTLAHSDEEVRAHAREHWVATTECWVANDDGGAVVAMMALTPGWIDQLYVAPDWLGKGIGRQLLELAKSRAGDDGLQLWTFQVNNRARRFYERNGFIEAERTDGSGNEEREPDVRYVWCPS